MPFASISTARYLPVMEENNDITILQKTQAFDNLFKRNIITHFGNKNQSNTRYCRENLLDTQYPDRGDKIITNMPDNKVPNELKSLWEAMHKFDYVYELSGLGTYDSNKCKTVTTDTFKKQNGGICEDFVNYMHYIFPKVKHKCYVYGLNLQTYNDALFGKIPLKKGSYTGHAFYVYNDRILVEFTNDEMLGLTMFINPTYLFKAVMSSVFKKAMFLLNNIGLEESKLGYSEYLCEYIPDNKEVSHIDFFKIHAQDKKLTITRT